MKNRGEISLSVAKSLVMNRAGCSNYYTPTQIKSEGLHESMIEWKSISTTVKNLLNALKGRRANYECTANFQVCE